MFTQANIDKARRDGFADAKKQAIELAEKERAAAEKELGFAEKTGNFNQLTVAATKIRKETAKRIAAAIRKI